MEKEIKHLKQELSMHDVISSRGAKDISSGDVFSPEKQYEVQKVAMEFLTGKCDDIDFGGSMRMVKEYLAQMRNGYLKLKQESANLLE